MLYISKGTVMPNSTEQLLLINHCGKVFTLTELEAAIWLDGSRFFSTTPSSREADHLRRMGLIETEEDDSPLSRYRVLTRCICCPVESYTRIQLRWQASAILTWLEKAGLRLSVAELVYLAEHRIAPAKSLLGVENRHKLVSLIYMTNSIQDNLLEQQMENAAYRDHVVNMLLYLLRCKRLVLV